MSPTVGAQDVAVLALPQALPMEVGMPFQVLTSRTAEHYRVTLCGRRPGPVPTTGGFPVVAQAGLEAVVAADTVIVPAYRTAPEPPPDDVLDALRNAHTRGARIMSICVGAFALAAAGLTNIYLAGNPGERREAELAAGVTEFVHVGVDVLDVLQRAHDHIGTPTGAVTR